MPNPTAPGGSIESAVRIVAPNDIMVDRFIARWLRTHYPGWDADPHEIRELGNERYAVVYITSPNNPGRRVYFRRPEDTERRQTAPGLPALTALLRCDSGCRLRRRNLIVRVRPAVHTRRAVNPERPNRGSQHVH